MGCHLPVYRFVVSFVRDDLRGKVIWGAAERPSLVGDTLGEPKVGNLQVPVAIKQKVFGLQVSVNNVFGMEIFQRQRSLGGVKLGNWVGKSLYACVTMLATARTTKVHCQEKENTYARLPQQ